jgi:hypothetical protein
MSIIDPEYRKKQERDSFVKLDMLKGKFGYKGKR